MPRLESTQSLRMVWFLLVWTYVLATAAGMAQAEEAGTIPLPDAQRLVNEHYIPSARDAMERRGRADLAARYESTTAGQPLVQYELVSSGAGVVEVVPRYILVPAEWEGATVGLFGLDPATGDLAWRLDHALPTSELPVAPGPQRMAAAVERAGDLPALFDLQEARLVYADGRSYWYLPEKGGDAAGYVLVPVGDEGAAAVGDSGPSSGVPGFLVEPDPLPSSPVEQLEPLPQVAGDPRSADFAGTGAATWMVDGVPYYQQDCNLWCWAASLSMLHQWWSPRSVGKAHAQQTEIVRYAKGRVVCAGGSADDIHRVVQNWQRVNSAYEGFQTTYKGSGRAFQRGSPTGNSDDPKTWLAYLQAPVIAFVDTGRDGAANHAILIVGYDDHDSGGVVYVHDPWYSNWWPGHRAEPSYELALSYATFDRQWNTTYEGQLFGTEDARAPARRRGMVAGIPGDNRVAVVDEVDVRLSGPIDDDEMERVSDLRLGVRTDATAPSVDSFGEASESGLSVALTTPGQGRISLPVELGSFAAYRPELPGSEIHLLTHSMPEGQERTGASFYVDPDAVGEIELQAVGWVVDQDDRRHGAAMVSVADDRRGSGGSFKMPKPELARNTADARIERFRVKDDDAAGPDVTDHDDSGDASPGTYRFMVQLRDSSGILDDSSYPKVYVRWDGDEIDATYHDGTFDADWDGSWYVATMPVTADRVGHTLYWRVLAQDGDEDRVDDRSATWSAVYRGGTIAPGDRPSPPAHVHASDGTFGEKVQVGWDAVPAALFYEVFRAAPAAGTGVRVGSAEAAPYDDLSAAAGTVYHYWVTACGNAGCSDPSAPDSGFRAPPAPSVAAGSTGASVTHRWRRIRFPTAFSEPPVLVAQVVSERSPDNCHIDLKQVTATGFSVRVQEDLGEDGTHRKAERVHWLALPPGDYGSVKAGKTGAVVTDQWRRVEFPSPFRQTPVLVAEITTENHRHNAHIDIKDVTAHGFTVRVEEDMRLDGSHPAEEVHWIAALPGRNDLLLAGTTGGRVTDAWQNVAFSPAYAGTGTPILVAQLVSDNETDNAHLDLRDPTPRGFYVRVEEDTEADGRHGEETVDYIAVER